MEADHADSPRALRETVIRWLVCPVCRGSLALDGNSIVCLACSRRYPVLDGLPVLLQDRAL